MNANSSSLNSQSLILNPPLDLFIIGGGINGVGIANDAAGRGLSVAICEQNDLGSGTSWKSSKLIHGGLRYLQYYDFQLVHKALKEREILLKKAPHIIQPLQFVLPYDQSMKPAWMISLGLFLYDHLAKRRLLPGSKVVNLEKTSFGEPLNTTHKRGFTYYDCYVDDARLVVLNAVQAKQFGATVYTRTKLIAAKREAIYWEITLQNTVTGDIFSQRARMLINATGPWLEKTLQLLNVKTYHHIKLVKGSHIVVPKFYSGDHAYVLQNDDNRIVFVIPFETHFCMIGTTDVTFTNDLQTIAISEDEIDYLSAVIKRYFIHSINKKDIVWTFSGVRPLHEGKTTHNLSAISRDYLLDLNYEVNKAPLLNIFGGKITTYRELSEHVLQLSKPFFPQMRASWTAITPLPGGDMPNAHFANFITTLQQTYPWLPQGLLQRYARNYGTRIAMILNGANSLMDLGKHYSSGFYQREVEYLVKHEWVQTTDDILWRRTKLGLTFPSTALSTLKIALENICKIPSLG